EVKHAFSDKRGDTWTINDIAVVNPSFVDRPWIAVFPSKSSADHDQVYVSYHDFSVSQIWVAASNDGGNTFGPSVDVLGTNGMAFANSFCNTVPSDIEVDPETGEVYVQWITADPVMNVGQGCNISQIQNFHQVWVAHSPPATQAGLTVWDAHRVFDGGLSTNTDEIFATLAVDDSGAPGVGGNIYSVFPFAQTINRNTATPKFAQTSASSGVMHVGGICTNGIFCSVSGGNRDLADSISIVIDRGGSAALAWTDQGTVLHGPTHITYGCVKAQQSAIVGANPGLSCKGPAGP